MFTLLFAKLDQIICSYLGLENEELRPYKVHRLGQQLWVKHTSSFKRHPLNSAWEELQDEKKESLGEQAGQAIAKELIITFKEPTIRMNTNA